MSYLLGIKMETQLIEKIEFKDQATQAYFDKLLNPKVPRLLPAKIAIQKFKGGHAIWTLITRD